MQHPISDSSQSVALEDQCTGHRGHVLSLFLLQTLIAYIKVSRNPTITTLAKMTNPPSVSLVPLKIHVCFLSPEPRIARYCQILEARQSQA